MAKGKNAIISAMGIDSKVKGRAGTLITLTEWIFSYKEDKLIPTQPKTAEIDGITLKENTFYTLRHGEFVEVGKD